jgi:hypothetical protein
MTPNHWIVIHFSGFPNNLMMIHYLIIINLLEVGKSHQQSSLMKNNCVGLIFFYIMSHDISKVYLRNYSYNILFTWYIYITRFKLIYKISYERNKSSNNSFPQFLILFDFVQNILFYRIFSISNHKILFWAQINHFYRITFKTILYLVF